MYTLIMTASPRDKRAETETLEHGLHYRKDSPTRSVFYSPTDSLLPPHPLMIRLEIRLLGSRARAVFYSPHELAFRTEQGREMMR